MMDILLNEEINRNKLMNNKELEFEDSTWDVPNALFGSHFQQIT